MKLLIHPYWRKIGIVAAIAAVVVTAVIVGLPRVVDVEAYKPGMIEAVREATGRELVIDGPMKLTMFPVPGIGAGTVHFSNAVGAVGAQMLDVRWVAVKPDWWALLQGRVAVGTLTLYAPTIVLETDANGRPNWEFAPGGNTKEAAEAPSKGFHLAMGRVEIVHGVITYTDPQTKKTIQAIDVNGGASVKSFDGPFNIDAKATVNDVPLKLDVSVGPATDAGHKATVSLKVSSGELEFKGTTSAISLDARIQGHLSVKTGLLSDFVNSVVSATGAPKPAFDTSGAGRFTFDGDIEVAPERIAATGFDVKMGKDDVKGTLSLALGDVVNLEGNVSLSRLDVGSWLEILARPIDFTPDPEPVKSVASAPTPQAAATKAATAVINASPWSRVNANVTVAIIEALYNNDAIRDFSATIDMKKGVVVVPKMKASLPGGVSIDVDAGSGKFNMSAKHLRDTLKWLGIDASGVPAGKLDTLTAEGTLASKAGGLDLKDGTFKLDGVPGTLGGTLSLKTPVTAALAVAMDRFDLDAYMPASSSSSTSSPATPPAATEPSAAAPSLGLKLDIAKLVYRQETLSGVTGGATLRGNVLKLDDIKVANLLGARLALKGKVQDFGTVPRFDLSFNITAPDTDLLVDYAGLPKFLNGKIGPSTATGTVAGTREAVTVRDASAHFLDTDARVSGTLVLTEVPTFDFSTFNLSTPEASKFVGVASGQAMGALGPIAATGALKGSSERSVFTGEFDVRGTHMTGSIDATLGKRPKLAAKLKVPKTLDIDKLLGIEDDSAPPPPPPQEEAQPAAETGAAVDPPLPPARKATAKPINLTALRSFDATLSISAQAMSLSALKVDYADLDATLTNGVLKIGKLTGQFYKGAVDFTGTIDASGSALAIDATGSLRGLHLAHMLRSTIGRSVFGSAFKIAVGGKIDATGIHLTGKGQSAVELRESIAGTTAVSGYMRTRMDGGTQDFAKFATGIGSLFSTDLAFDSLVLNGFVNQENTLSGGMTLGNGTITLQNQTVRGRNATAVISGPNRIAEGTTDMTIQLTGGGKQYVATVKGQLSSPDISASRPAR